MGPVQRVSLSAMAGSSKFKPPRARGEEVGSHYYLNSQTGEATWVQPT